MGRRLLTRRMRRGLRLSRRDKLGVDGIERNSRDTRRKPLASPTNFAAPSMAVRGMGLRCLNCWKMWMPPRPRPSRCRRFTASGSWCCTLRCGTTRRLRRLEWRESVSPPGLANFPLVPKPTEAAWRKAVAETKRTHDALVKTVAALPDSRLRRTRSGQTIRLLSHAARNRAA